MIISCEKCNKKFELADNLMPNTGRLLQCGSCSYQWHYIPESIIELVDEVKDENELTDQPDKILQPTNIKKIKKHKASINKDIYKPYSEETKSTKKSVGFFSYLLVLIISLVGLVILIDTFKLQLSNIIPNLDFYLVSLHDTLKDIFLFFEDLIK